jgi:hypothetical protein
MVLKIPPPPPIANQDQAFNRWLLEITAILSAGGDIDPGSIAGLDAAFAQIAVNTANIAALQGTTGGQSAAILALQASVVSLTASIATINGQITTLSSRAQVLNGAGAPAAGLGSVGDWYGDTTLLHIYIKTGAATWTFIV